MNKFLINKDNRRLNFTSRYNVKLYKKCLSFKLIFLTQKFLQPNLIVSRDKNLSVKFLKKIYCRKEKVPLRLLRFFFLLNYTKLINLGVKYLVSKKLSVYNGKRAKLINVNQGLLEVTLRCGFRFGDLIFTRARYRFKKKNKKKK